MLAWAIDDGVLRPFDAYAVVISPEPPLLPSEPARDAPGVVDQDQVERDEQQEAREEPVRTGTELPGANANDSRHSVQRDGHPRAAGCGAGARGPGSWGGGP